MRVPAEWRRMRVEDLAAPERHALATGPFGSSISAKHFVESGVPVIRGKNLSDTIEQRLNDEGLAFVTPERAASFQRSIARVGDLIFTCWGTVGQVGLIDRRATYPRYVVSNKQMKLTPDPTIADSLYLYYVFSSPEVVSLMRDQAIGSSVPGFNLRQLRSFIIPMPPLEEQRRIATVLGVLDDKIELNRVMSNTLEEMSWALYRSRFMDFGDRTDLEDSDLGPIPRGWRTDDLASVARYLRRGFGPRYVNSGGVLVLNQRCIRDGAVNIAKARRHDPRARSIVGRELQPGDILVNSTGVGTLGRVAVLLDFGMPLIVDSHVTVVRADREMIHPLVLGIGMRMREAEIAELGEGSTGQIELSHKRLGGLRVLVPPTVEQERFARAVAPLQQRMHHARMESRILLGLRDALLPELLSGALRVTRAEELLTRVS